ncbi:MAG: hypothetical protein H7Z75_00700, partial [Ferruginibacter sp.]|nr:hypothetical protein [Cytophagales bacterium]
EYDKDPNNFVNINEFFDVNDLVMGWNNTRDIFEQDEVIPIADVRGSMAICVGYGKDNLDQVYYWHMDFGYVYITDLIDKFVDYLEENKEW